MAEIADADLLSLRQAKELLEQLYQDGETSTELKRLVRKKFPKANIPELDVMDSTAKQLAAMSERLDKRDADDAEARKKADEAAFEQSIDVVVKQRGYTDEGRKKLLDIMQSKKVYDPEIAANEFDRQQPKVAQQPKGYSGRISFLEKQGKDDASFDQLVNDPEGWMIENMTREIAAFTKEQ